MLQIERNKNNDLQRIFKELSSKSACIKQEAAHNLHQFLAKQNEYCDKIFDNLHELLKSKEKPPLNHRQIVSSFVFSKRHATSMLGLVALLSRRALHREVLRMSGASR